MELIPLDAVLAEIENRIKELQNLYKENEEKLDSIQKTAILLCIDECKVILYLINTLEVKEVDFEKEIKEEYLKRRYYGGRDNMLVILNEPQFNEIAKHFFELGLKAQKGE